MTLGDLRRVAIRQQFKIRFRLRNGLECVITEQGVAQVPALRGIPDFNLEEELASANEFLLDPVDAPNTKNATKNARRAHTIRRDDLARMSESTPSSAAAPSHDDE